MTVLFYHGVEYEIIDPLVQDIQMPFKCFEEQIKYLRNNFEFISPDYLYDCLRNCKKIDSEQILITFDDGYRNNFSILSPFLKTYNIPFLVFISTNHITMGSRFPTYYLKTSILYTDHEYLDIPSIKEKMDLGSKEKRVHAINTISKILKAMPQDQVHQIVKELISLIPNDRWLELNNTFSSDKPMNWNEVKQLHDSGATIGSHCHDHAILHNNQSNVEINYQLKTSKDLIEKKLGECKYFAYPNGGINDITPESVIDVGKNNYLLGFTTVYGEVENKSNSYILPRILPSLDIDEFKFIINTGFRYNNSYQKWCSKY